MNPLVYLTHMFFLLPAQGQYAAKLVTNQFKLPSQEAMLQSWLRHVHALKAHNMKIVHVNTIGDQMVRALHIASVVAKGWPNGRLPGAQFRGAHIAYPSTACGLLGHKHIKLKYGVIVLPSYS